MSKLAIEAVSATVMLAVNSPEFTKVVELTVTPPGSVVPVTNHFAFALFLKPLPVTFTLRLIVPCAVDAGAAAVTWTCWAWADDRAPVTLRKRKPKLSRIRMGAALCLGFIFPPSGHGIAWGEKETVSALHGQ